MLESTLIEYSSKDCFVLRLRLASGRYRSRFCIALAFASFTLNVALLTGARVHYYDLFRHPGQLTGFAKVLVKAWLEVRVGLSFY